MLDDATDHRSATLNKKKNKKEKVMLDDATDHRSATRE
jgi:hypothetical protein